MNAERRRDSSRQWSYSLFLKFFKVLWLLANPISVHASAHFRWMDGKDLSRWTGYFGVMEVIGLGRWEEGLKKPTSPVCHATLELFRIVSELFHAQACFFRTAGYTRRSRLQPLLYYRPLRRRCHHGRRSRNIGRQQLLATMGHGKPLRRRRLLLPPLRLL